VPVILASVPLSRVWEVPDDPVLEEAAGSRWRAVPFVLFMAKPLLRVPYFGKLPSHLLPIKNKHPMPPTSFLLSECLDTASTVATGWWLSQRKLAGP
jgi:hypothetical protein